MARGKDESCFGGVGEFRCGFLDEFLGEFLSEFSAEFFMCSNKTTNKSTRNPLVFSLGICPMLGIACCNIGGSVVRSNGLPMSAGFVCCGACRATACRDVRWVLQGGSTAAGGQVNRQGMQED